MIAEKRAFSQQVAGSLLLLTVPVNESPERLLRNIHGHCNVQPDIQDGILGASGIVKRVIPCGTLSAATAAGVRQREPNGGPNAVLSSRGVGVIQVSEAAACLLATKVDVDVLRVVFHRVAVLVVRVQVFVNPAGATLLCVPKSDCEGAVGVVVKVFDSDVAARIKRSAQGQLAASGSECVWAEAERETRTLRRRQSERRSPRPECRRAV